MPRVGCVSWPPPHSNQSSVSLVKQSIPAAFPLECVPPGHQCQCNNPPDNYFKACHRGLFYGWSHVCLHRIAQIPLGLSYVGLFDGRTVTEEEMKRTLNAFKGNGCQNPHKYDRAEICWSPMWKRMKLPDCSHNCNEGALRLNICWHCCWKGYLLHR